jgi:hypothetical protein
VSTPKATAKPRTKAKPSDLGERGATVISVYGPFSSRCLVEMSADLANELFPKGLGVSSRSNVISAAEHDVDKIRERSPELAESALAAAAIRLAYEIEHPFNSATSKSMCAREMREVLGALRDLAPEEQTKDGLDDLSAARAKRRQAAH